MSDKPAAPTGKPPSEPTPRNEGPRPDGPRGDGPRGDGSRTEAPRGDTPQSDRAPGGDRGRRQRGGRGGRGGRPDAPRGDRPRGNEPPRSGEPGNKPRSGEPQRPPKQGRPEGGPSQHAASQPGGGEQRRGQPPRSARSGGQGRPEPRNERRSEQRNVKQNEPQRPPRGDQPAAAANAKLDSGRSGGTPSSPSTLSGSPSEPGERRRRRRRGRGGRGSERSIPGEDSGTSIPPLGEPSGLDSQRVLLPTTPAPIQVPAPSRSTTRSPGSSRREESDEANRPTERAAETARELDGDDDDAAGDVRRLRPVSELELPPDVPVRMANLCALRFRPSGMIYELDCGSQSYEAGELVMCESDRGQRVGRVEVPPRPRPAMGQRRRVLRKARPDETGGFGESQQSEGEAYRFCKARLRELGLPMKLLQVEVQVGQKATFFFASEDRIDFRDLVRDLSARLRVRVEMRQVGARDGAKAVGGIGSCGRELCCSTFLPAFQPISIRMAKDQGMVLNPSKLAGQCGRLKCCLIYEHSTYKELGKTLPKVGKKVITPDGMGRVLDLDILKQRVRVYLEEGGAKSYAAAEVRSANPPQGGSHVTPDSATGDDLEN